MLSVVKSILTDTPQKRLSAFLLSVSCLSPSIHPSVYMANRSIIYFSGHTVAIGNTVKDPHGLNQSLPHRFSGRWIHSIVPGITGAALTEGHLQEPVEIPKGSLEGWVI